MPCFRDYNKLECTLNIRITKFYVDHLEQMIHVKLKTLKKFSDLGIQRARMAHLHNHKESFLATTESI